MTETDTQHDKLYMVFDVESVGLHGEGFAAGFVVVNQYGIEIQSGLMCCPPDAAKGTDNSREWVKQNIPNLSDYIGAITRSTPAEVRDVFWQQWLAWKERGAVLVADCCWPVEAKFLEQCVQDKPEEREWQGPYPLHDLASILLTNRISPTETFERKENELPAHNPLCDARQSARILTAQLATTACIA